MELLDISQWSKLHFTTTLI